MLTKTTNKKVYDIITDPSSTYDIPFPYWNKEEIDAYITNADGSLTDLKYNIDYSVSEPNGENGTLTRLTAWTGAKKLTIIRVLPFTQDINLENGAVIDAETLERLADRTTAMIQQQNEKLGRTFTFRIDEQGGEFQFPGIEERKNAVIGFNENGESMRAYKIEDLAVRIESVSAVAHALPVGEEPTVSVSMSGTPLSRIFDFNFGIPISPNGYLFAIDLMNNIESISVKFNGEDSYKTFYNHATFYCEVGDVLSMYATPKIGFLTEHDIDNPLTITMTSSGYTFKPIATREYFTLVADDDLCIIQLDKHGNPYNISLEYTTDDITWHPYTTGASGEVIVLDNTGDFVRFRNSQDTIQNFAVDFNNYYNFTSSERIKARGNIMSLVDKTANTTEIPNEYCFACLFLNMANLVQAPILLATTLKLGCYQAMFGNCTGLTVAPELPAEVLAANCYSQMFEGCTSLEDSGELKSINLVNGCYERMFFGCSALTSIKVLFTSWNTSCTQRWVENVSSNGTFICPSTLSDERGVSQIPSEWTKQDI